MSRDRLLVVCGAKATEIDYLRGLVQHVENPAVTVKIITKPCSPSQLISHAEGQRARARDDFDEVWCVFDVDEYQDVSRAVAQARDAAIEVVVSNPCFELWLILHFSDHQAYTRTYRELLPHLTRHVTGYDKARLGFRKFADGWEAAVPRAKKLAPPGKEHEVNPATGMWALVERIAGTRA
ncbi:RloB family protein [Streptomyces sp. NPDC051286]|uniref:RloB family protein n=1 Tax=Streptomyces sp. NPDC051286 TaxID=3365647 RepID=UPI00378BF86F